VWAREFSSPFQAVVPEIAAITVDAGGLPAIALTFLAGHRESIPAAITTVVARNSSASAAAVHAVAAIRGATVWLISARGSAERTGKNGNSGARE
jgi:hypothetical protein